MQCQYGLSESSDVCDNFPRFSPISLSYSPSRCKLDNLTIVKSQFSYGQYPPWVYIIICHTFCSRSEFVSWRHSRNFVFALHLFRSNWFEVHFLILELGISNIVMITWRYLQNIEQWCICSRLQWSRIFLLLRILKNHM